MMFHWSDKIRNEFYHPKNVGELDKKAKNVLWQEYKSHDGFTHCQFFIKVNNNNIIQLARFKALGDPCLIACLSFLTQAVKGKPLAYLNSIKPQTLIEALDLPKERFSAALMAVDLLQQFSTSTSNYAH